jgi:hypothetical protein
MRRTNWPAVAKPRHPRHTTVRRRWPERYFSGLSKLWRRRREIELIRRRRNLHPKLSKSNQVLKKRPKSKWTVLFHKTYPGLKFNKAAISRRTGIPVGKLNTVYNRGLKAWKTGGSRPGASAQQWGIARMYKFVLVTKRKAPVAWYATRFDPDNDLRLHR